MGIFDRYQESSPAEGPFSPGPSEPAFKEQSDPGGFLPPAPRPDIGPATRPELAVGALGMGELAADEAVQGTARRGIAGAGEPLPYLGAIQRSFGSHDVSGIQAHTGGRAQDAARALRATAYATGSHIAFAGPPDLHTAAHEAAHTVQQRGGVSLKSSLGPSSDPHEVDADAVADRVVAGESAEDLLDGMDGGPPAIQREAAPAGGQDEAAIVAELVKNGERNESTLTDHVFYLRHPELQGARLQSGSAEAIEWLQVRDQIVRPALKAPAGAAPTTGGSVPAAPAEEPSLLGGLLDMAGGAVDSVTGAVTGAVGSVTDAASSLWSWLVDGEETPPGAGGPTEAPSETPAETAPATGPIDTTHRDNLDVAEEIAARLNVGHGYDPEGKNVAGDTTDPAKRAEAIKNGDEDALKSILCSEFTNLTLAEAGYDLNDRYLDPESKLNVAYQEKSGRVTFVTLYMVTNSQPEATGALLDVQRGGAERIEGGSEQAKQLGVENEGEFWLSKSTTFVGLAADAGDEFGAGVTAVSLGGIEVNPEDRKPGDLQQWLTTKDGKYTGGGHSSQVYSVRGTGIAWLGGSGSPTVVGDVKSPGPASELTPGWYRIDGSDGLAWEINSDTQPDRVATLTATSIQLIDANTNRGDDATAVGSFGKAPTASVVSNGRLRTSPWIEWQPNDAAQVVGVLSSKAA